MKKKAQKIILIAALAVAFCALLYTAAALFTLSFESGEQNGFVYAVSHLASDPPGSVFSKIVYKCFGAVTADGVRAGKDGYLFPTKGDFDYGADLRGELTYDSQTLSEFLSELSRRRDAYAADGCEYRVFVIPNSQTVLTDKLRAKKTGQSGAEQLEKYLHDNGFDDFYLLDTALSHSKYQTYHNTDNAVNDYGAYLVYKRIAALMPDAVSRRAEETTLTETTLRFSESDGRALAASAGIEKLCRNRNVYYDTAPLTDKYDVRRVAGLTVCEMKDEYNGFIGRSKVLLQIPDGYERSLLLPLFASTYTNTVCADVLGYSRAAAEQFGADICVCVIRQDGLDALLDRDDSKTYTAHLDGIVNGVSAPEPVTASLRADGRVIIAGECAEACYVTVTSSSGSVRVRGEGGLFIAELPSKGGEKLKLYAESDAGIRSDTVAYTAPARATASEGVVAGGSSMLLYGQTFADFTGDNLLKADKLALVRKRVEKIRDSVRKSSGKDTKIIILAAPDPLSVYPEAAPDELYGKRGAVSRLDQYRTALSDVEGVVFLDVRAEMQQNRDIGRLYYQTDTHWTETGAYFGYRAITDAISADFPSVTPYPFNAFKAETAEAVPGDLAGFADLHGISERITVLRPVTRQRAVGLPEKPDTIDRSIYGGELTSAVNDDSLPVAVMIRDSYSANLFPLIGEHFSFLYAQSMWRYDPEYKKIAEYAPDYVIYVICERNLGIWE